MGWCACGLGILHFFTSWAYQFWGSQMQWMGAFETTPPAIIFNFQCIPVILFIFISRHLKSAGHYGIPSVKNLRWVSVRLSVCYHLIFALWLEYFSTDIIQTLYKSWYWGGAISDHRWVNLSNKHRDILSFMLKIAFGALSWPIISVFFFKLQMRVDIRI